MDTGIGSWAQLVDAFEHIQSPDAFVQAASDIFLVDQPSKRQILCLQLLVEEARTIPVWTEPPPLSRRPVSAVESGTPPSTPAASVNLTPAPSAATPGDPIELILSDLRKWKREIQDLATLSSRIQGATWYKDLISICQEEGVHEMTAMSWKLGGGHPQRTPPVSHMSDYWVPWDEVLDSMVEYHLFVADVAVIEHVSEISTASRNYLQLCQEPCFWEECRVSVHHVTGVQIAEALSNASQRVRMLENRVAALEAEVAAIRHALGI
eukprot:s744_g18.t1